MFNIVFRIDFDVGVQIDKLVDVSTSTELKIIVSIRNPNGKVMLGRFYLFHINSCGQTHSECDRI